MLNPQFGLILGYKHFFSDTPPANRIDLIKSISKIDLLGEFAACNYRIKPPKKIFFDYSSNITISELKFHLRNYPEFIDKAVTQFLYHLNNTSKNSLIFHRAGMLYAINEVLQSDKLEDKKGFLFTGYDQVNIFKYILLVNDEVTKLQSEILNVGTFSDFEKFNLASLSLNEYFIPIDPLLALFRAGSMFRYLNKTDYKESVSKFIESNTGFSPQRFIYEIISLYFAKHMKNSELNWYYKLNKGDPVVKFFNYLSTRRQFEDNNLEFLDMKKSPFLKAGEHQFILFDNMFLLALSYDLFIWNFLFDNLLADVVGEKERQDIIKNFKGVIGQFYESHLTKILRSSLIGKGYIIRTFKDLQVKINKRHIELADVYIRKKNKIIVGEAKTTSIVNKEKYASSVDEFYNGDPDSFFRKHGLSQLANSIKEIIQYGKLIDNGFPSKRIKLYPVLFFNDILLCNPFFPKIFDNHFSKLIEGIDDPCVRIYPLTLVHISDLEIIENALVFAKPDIFKILHQHILMYDNRFPFLYSSNKKSRKGYSKRVIEYYHTLIKAYSKTNTNKIS